MPRAMLGIATLAGLMFVSSIPATAQDEVKPYLIATNDAYEVAPLLSVGDTVPYAADTTKQYQMVGIPDGLARTRVDNGRFTLYMNHEFRNDLLSEPVIGDPNERGSFVSEFRMTTDGEVLSGRRAYDNVYLEDQFIGPAAREDNDTPAFGRLCSMSLVGPAHGFDRRMVITVEETDTPDAVDTFDPLGGSTIAIFDRNAYALPNFGHLAKENTLFMSETGKRTVAVSLEDGPITPDSQLYLYVGVKRPNAASPLAKNGLSNGKLYVFVSTDETKTSEDTFLEGAITGEWVEIPDAGAMTDVELEAASDALGAFGFIRIEDGDYSKTDPGDLFFVTTGAPNTGNSLGRLYRLAMDPSDPLANPRLSIQINGADSIAAGEDTVISGDNLVVTRSHIAIQEGGTGATRPVITELGREFSVWTIPLVDGRHTNLDIENRLRIAQLNPPGRDGTPVPIGQWEPSGIISGAPIFGSMSWLQTVQAHPPTKPPGVNTVQDGQLVLLKRKD